MFLICSEGLSSLFRSRVRTGHLKGAQVSRGAPSITHLLFADDCLIFGEASTQGATIISNILSHYSSCSGQLINFDKSGVFFSSNVSDFNKSEICRIIGVHSTSNPERYLGFPPIVGRNKKAAFADLHGKFIKRCAG
ncbi:hypothetical protein V6N13_099325 [Hibiscus sabdariffa]